MGVSGTKLYENWLLARLGRKGLRDHLQSSTIRLVAIVLNFHFQCVSMAIFSQRNVGDTCTLSRADPGDHRQSVLILTPIGGTP